MKYILILLILWSCTKPCEGQPLIVPKIVNPTASNQILMWDGTLFKLVQLTGFTINSTTVSPPSTVDNSVTNEGLLSISGNTLVSGVTLTSNTSGSTSIKIAGADGTYIHKSNDTIIIGNTNTNHILTNHSAITVTNSTTQTPVGGTLIEVEDGLNFPFTIYLHYTTGSTSQGLQFRLNPSGSGTFWYDYNFPITGSRVSGSIYNANTTTTIPSSESGTNIAVIRGIVKSSAIGAGIFSIQLQVSAEDGSSTVTTLTTGVTQQQ